MHAQSRDLIAWKKLQVPIFVRVGSCSCFFKRYEPLCSRVTMEICWCMIYSPFPLNANEAQILDLPLVFFSYAVLSPLQISQFRGICVSLCKKLELFGILQSKILDIAKQNFTFVEDANSFWSPQGEERMINCLLGSPPCSDERAADLILWPSTPTCHNSLEVLPGHSMVCTPKTIIACSLTLIQPVI